MIFQKSQFQWPQLEKEKRRQDALKAAEEEEKFTYLQLTRNAFDATATVSDGDEDGGVLPVSPRKQSK